MKTEKAQPNKPKRKKKSNAGRPTVVTAEVLQKLEYAFSIGCTDREACIYANIAPATLYDYQKEHSEFSERKEELKEEPVLKARETVVKSLRSPQMATWYLTRKRKDEFAERHEHTGADGEKLFNNDEKEKSQSAVKDFLGGVASGGDPGNS